MVVAAPRHTQPPAAEQDPEPGHPPGRPEGDVRGLGMHLEDAVLAGAGHAVLVLRLDGLRGPAPPRARDPKLDCELHGDSGVL